jgi:nucleotide-binding universal stress UspA family protein
MEHRRNPLIREVIMQNVVVATNLTPTSDAAVERAAFASCRLGAGLHLVHVVPELLLPPALGGTRVKKADDALRYRARVVDRRFGPPVVSCNVAQGDTSRCIVRESEDMAAVLTVLGHRTEGRNKRNLTGTIPERSLRLIRNAVLIVCDRSPREAGYRKALLAPDGGVGKDAMMPHVRHLAPDAAIHSIDPPGRRRGGRRAKHQAAEHIRTMRRALDADLLVISMPRDESLNPFRFRRLLTPLVRVPECDTLIVPQTCDAVPPSVAEPVAEKRRIRIAS